MENRFDTKVADKLRGDDLAMRVYTSNILGVDENLVLHGGGNTSVKIDGVLHVKGSGWDLSDIKKEGFAPVKMDALLAMAELENLSDSDMVTQQREAMLDRSAPNPSIEAILHALIPYKFVDHTHADSVVTLTNTPDGKRLIKELYGENMLIVPYVMPGFILAKKIYEMTRGIDWAKLDGMVLLNHGVFTFDDDAQKSYDKMIEIVAKAERFITENLPLHIVENPKETIDLHKLATIRKEAAKLRGSGIVARLNDSPEALHFSNQANVECIVDNGPLTPEHVIRTKPSPVIIGEEIEKEMHHFVSQYREYFNAHADGHTMLDPAPRYAVWQGHGVISLGSSIKETRIISDITSHTIHAMLVGERLDVWKSLSKEEIFEMEYWELEQAKLKKAGTPSPLAGKIALVIDGVAESGEFLIETLAKTCGVVAVLGLGADLKARYPQANVLAIECDVSDPQEYGRAIDSIVYAVGGIDLFIDNSETDLVTHEELLNGAGSYLELGFEPKALVFTEEGTQLRKRPFDVSVVDNNKQNIDEAALLRLCE